MTFPSSSAVRKNSTDIPDPTDWLGTPLACLKPVELAFRCHVCKDFFNSPMITSCNHTFCSLCIRRCLSTDGKCPVCRAADQESKLRGNWALREAVDAFCESRNTLLAVAKTPMEPATRSVSAKRRAAEHSTDDEPSVKRSRTSTRISTRSSKARATEAMAAQALEEEDAPEIVDLSEEDEAPDDGLAACPICWVRMKPWQVDKHIDTSCPGEPQPNSAAGRSGQNSGLGGFGFAKPSQSTRSKPPERLPPVNYSLLTDISLRKKMSLLSLPTTGNRLLLERRHKEWVTIWNANCDSARPKGLADLLQDLEVWERTLGGRAPIASRASLGAQIKDKNFDTAAWSVKHDASFKDLIANAQMTIQSAAPKAAGTTSIEPSPGAADEHRNGSEAPAEIPGRGAEHIDLTSAGSVTPELGNAEALVSVADEAGLLRGGTSWVLPREQHHEMVDHVAGELERMTS